MPRLQVLNGKRQGAVFEVKAGVEALIGHRQTATIAIDDPWVSWDHARLFFDHDATCWIEDLGSTNGTYVNCVRVKREVLRHEDIIFLGKTHVIFLSPAEESFGLEGGLPEPQPVSWTAVGAAPEGPFDARTAKPGPGPIVRAPSSSAGQHRAAGHPMASSAGPFRSDSGVPPLRDPFASGNVAAPTWGAPPAGKPKRDPFADSSVDPFASGADFAPPVRPPPPPPPTPSQMLPQAERARRAFADTNADDDLLGGAAPGAQQPGRSLSLSDLSEDLGAGSAVPVHEISQLIEGYDDLDTILGDGRARTPDPAFARPRTAMPSEMRTRPIDTDAARRILAEEEARAPAVVRETPSTLSMPAVTIERSSEAAARIVPPQPQVRPEHAAPPPPAPAPPPPAEFARPEALDPAGIAFERARLEDEVRRLRAALQAARATTPETARAAAEVLRDQELGRLARRVAELERDVVRLRQELAEKQAELDGVTEEMIDKEDRIERLEERLRERLSASTDADLEAMELP
ncbi:MAG: FHA domain-containing protein [Planctomycetes bacterium]|nr:FHA domain-containing protein [Planctomycetota bacterium]